MIGLNAGSAAVDGVVFKVAGIEGDDLRMKTFHQLFDRGGIVRFGHRPGESQYYYALFCFWQGDLTDAHLTKAKQLAKTGKSRTVVPSLHALRGEWHLERSEWALATEGFQEAVSMARTVGRTDPKAEAQLALAPFHLDQLPDPRAEAEQLANAKWIPNRHLAVLWLAIGEPFVFRYGLNKARALLEKLGAEIPNLPPYDPAKDGKFPCEDEVVAAIEKLQAEKEPQDRDAHESKPKS
jgi:hypothetical protein